MPAAVEAVLPGGGGAQQRSKRAAPEQQQLPPPGQDRPGSNEDSACSDENSADGLGDGGNAYEQQRQARIARNRALLAELGVDEAAQAVQQAANRAKRARHAKPKEPAPEVAPSRRSSRRRAMEEAAAAADAGGTASGAAGGAAGDDDSEAGPLLTQEEYFKQAGVDVSGALLSDGRFKGWVAPGVCQRYGIAPSAAEAWEAGGGGAYSRKPDMAAVPAHLRAKGWSDAKAFAATQMLKNPNSYFYRHVVPHEEQATGEWTDEEHELFLATARAHGVGDKWGLFATHIPQRVGYQCSAYYRDVCIARGLVLDGRFRLTRSGRAVFVG